MRPWMKLLAVGGVVGVALGVSLAAEKPAERRAGSSSNTSRPKSLEYFSRGGATAGQSDLPADPVVEELAAEVSAAPKRFTRSKTEPTETATPEATRTADPTATSTPVASATGTPAPTVTATPALDHFLCYETHRRALNRKGVSANDDLGNTTITVRQAKRLCAPVNKNNEDPTAPLHPGHETFYTIKQTSPHFAPVKNLTITDQFGTIQVDLVRPERLLVPTSKSLTAPPPPPLATPLDHFKCYRVRGARVRVPNVSVQTQFNPGGPITVAIKRPRDLCLPVDKNGEGILNSTIGLMCYQVRTSPQSPPRVFTTDQFESADYPLFGIRDLCVPLLAGPGTCGDGKLNAPGEQCETGNDGACPGDCNLQTCACPVVTGPTCGDGVINQQSEECETADDCDLSCLGPRCLVALAPIGPTCVACQCVPPPFCGDDAVNLIFPNSRNNFVHVGFVRQGK